MACPLVTHRGCGLWHMGLASVAENVVHGTPGPGLALRPPGRWAQAAVATGAGGKSDELR